MHYNELGLTSDNVRVMYYTLRNARNKNFHELVRVEENVLNTGL